MFSGKTPVEAIADAEIVDDDEKAERAPLELDADRLREQAFKVQEWTTNAFGRMDAPGTEFRTTFRDGFYYVETLRKAPGAPTAYAYAGVMLAEADLFAFAKTIVAAVKAKQERDGTRAKSA